MTKRRTVIITNNKEIYNKFNMLHFSSEVFLKDVKQVHIDKIIKNINRDGIKVTSELVNNYILVKKNQPVDFNIYLK